MPEKKKFRLKAKLLFLPIRIHVLNNIILKKYIGTLALNLSFYKFSLGKFIRLWYTDRKEYKHCDGKERSP